MVFRQMRRDSVQIEAASAVLGMPTKELQNLVQFGVVKPRRRRGLYFFIPRACTKPKLLVISSSLSEPPPTS